MQTQLISSFEMIEENQNAEHDLSSVGREAPEKTMISPSHRKQVIVILSVVAVVVIALGIYLMSSKTSTPVNSLYGDNLSPEARKEKIIQRINTADTQPLTPDELRYIFNWVASGDGRKFPISQEEKAKIVKAINS